MEITRYICEFFFCNFLHFLELLLLVAVVGRGNIITINSKEDNNEKE